MTERIKLMSANASFSRLEYYKNCPAAYVHKYVHKLTPLDPPVQKDKNGQIKMPAHERGSLIHQNMEDFINGKTRNIMPELACLRNQLISARKLRMEDPDRVITEQKWYMDESYQLIEYDPEEPPLEYHLLVIIDLLILDEDKRSARVIDLKSGKRFRNEIKHARQTQLYAFATSQLYPEIENFMTEIWYCDIDHIEKKPYTLEDLDSQYKYWDNTVKELKNPKVDPTPHEQRCMFCNWGLKEHSNQWVNKTGDCQYSMDKRFRT